MMYEEFATKVKEELEKELKGIQLVRHQADKVNGKKDAFAVIQNQSRVAPELYIEEYYRLLQEGYSFNNIMYNLKKNLKQTLENMPDIPKISVHEAKSNLFCALINAEQNKELLKDIPYEKVEDLALIARFRVGDEGSFIVSKDLCRALKLTEFETMEIAKRNIEKDIYECKEIREIMINAMRKQGVPEDYIRETIVQHEGDIPIYVLSNQQMQDGAVAIVSQRALDKVEKEIGEDCYILPSSRHEVLFVPKKDVPDPEQLKQIVKEVNMVEVEREDRLSNEVYEYNLETRQITIADCREQSPELTISKLRGR